MRITTIMSIAPRLTPEFKASVAAAVVDSASFHELNHKTFGSDPAVLVELVEALSTATHGGPRKDSACA